MLWYIIDGYNVIHKIKALKNSSFPQEEFLLFIRRYKLTGSKNNQVTVVFDGYAKPEFLRQFTEFKVIFSEGQTADTVIKNKVANAKNKKQIVVVTDDREILDFSRREGARLMKVIDFISPAKKKKKLQKNSSSKDISYSLEREITESLRNIWLKNE